MSEKGKLAGLASREREAVTHVLNASRSESLASSSPAPNQMSRRRRSKYADDVRRTPSKATKVLREARR